MKHRVDDSRSAQTSQKDLQSISFISYL